MPKPPNPGDPGSLENPLLVAIPFGPGGLRGFIGRPNPMKIGAGGRLQPYEITTGRYLPQSSNPGLVNSPAGQAGAGFVQGFAEGYSGASGSTPVGKAGNLGYTVGYGLGQILSIF